MDSRCPRKLKTFPKENCPDALEAIRGARNGVEQGCPWFVSDASACHCFFLWMAQNGNVAQTDAKISQLLLIPDQEVKSVIAKLRKRSQEFDDLDDEE